ncbi:uncharacterized protein C7orf50 homolog [Manduca sexta]|uniref:uncharacterized protein C7orf50 homolog n=1 Tax=Manduca sexta TaxID=7130 RepID=UPI001890946B|nr:uncharacterized protein C7orf50 homolog [Manduca sexta]
MGNKNKKRNRSEHDKKDKSNNSNADPQNVKDTEVETGDKEADNEEYENTEKLHDIEDNSEEDEPPKKKKKKKQAVVGETNEKKGKKSIRQMKKEKHLQRQTEAAAVAKDQLKSQCINYLSQWKHNRDNWKFMKAKQVWLFKNKFSSNLVPDSSWPTLLEYFESAKGNIRNMLLEDSKKVINQMDEWTEKQKDNKDTEANEDDVNDNETPSNKPDDTSYKRARDLIQCLEE